MMQTWAQWVLGGHIVAFVFWCTTLFSLAGLLVHHAQAAKEDDVCGCARFAVMEKRLFRGIMSPAMLAVIVLGIVLIVLNTAVLTRGWLYIKAALVIILIGYQHFCLAQMKRLASNKGHSPLYYRALVLVPAALIVAIILLSVLRPY